MTLFQVKEILDQQLLHLCYRDKLIIICNTKVESRQMKETRSNILICSAIYQCLTKKKDKKCSHLNWFLCLMHLWLLLVTREIQVIWEPEMKAENYKSSVIRECLNQFKTMCKYHLLDIQVKISNQKTLKECQALPKVIAPPLAIYSTRCKLPLPIQPILRLLNLHQLRNLLPFWTQISNHSEIW